MFLELTAPVLALMVGALLVHDATAMWDVTYAATKRNVTPSSSASAAFWRWRR